MTPGDGPLGVKLGGPGGTEAGWGVLLGGWGSVRVKNTRPWESKEK